MNDNYVNTARVLDRREFMRIIQSLMEELRLARQILDKGGVTSVESGETIDADPGLIEFGANEKIVPTTRRR